MIKVYLDLSVLNRIFDDQSQTRVYSESSAMIVVFSLIEARKIESISSEAHDDENLKNPFPEKKAFIDNVLRYSKTHRKIDEKILVAAENIEAEYGIKGYDAIHVAAAESMKADYFITCETTRLRR